jgi:hypothetical protein
MNNDWDWALQLQCRVAVIGRCLRQQASVRIRTMNYFMTMTIFDKGRYQQTTPTPTPTATRSLYYVRRTKDEGLTGDMISIFRLGLPASCLI